MKMLLIAASFGALMILGIAAMLVFGTAGRPSTLASLINPLDKIDFSDLPAIETIPARRGGTIAFRRWGVAGSAGDPTLILIHGSALSSTSLHPLGKALAAAGIAVYAPDIRGHGNTGRKGDIDYGGQLDDDLADLVAMVKAARPGSQLVLAGFSGGGGFALRSAALPQGGTFERVVLLSPMLGIRAPTVKSGGDQWVRLFIPRILALVVLDRLGIHAFDYLPVAAFAIPPERADITTSSYSFRLLRAFTTADYAADLKAVPSRIAVLVGEKDELFNAELFAPTVQAVRADAKVTVVPGINHIELTTDPSAVPAIVASVRGQR
jgi:alpha-beta hydrolase superfamily lysophospholipase